MAHYDAKDVMRAKPIANMSPETVLNIAGVKIAGQELYDLLHELPQSADMTLAKRKVEEAVMWAVKALTA